MPPTTPEQDQAWENFINSDPAARRLKRIQEEIGRNLERGKQKTVSDVAASIILAFFVVGGLAGLGFALAEPIRHATVDFFGLLRAALDSIHISSTAWICIAILVGAVIIAYAIVVLAGAFLASSQKDKNHE